MINNQKLLLLQCEILLAEVGIKEYDAKWNPGQTVMRDAYGKFASKGNAIAQDVKKAASSAVAGVEITADVVQSLLKNKAFRERAGLSAGLVGAKVVKNLATKVKANPRLEARIERYISEIEKHLADIYGDDKSPFVQALRKTSDLKPPKDASFADKLEFQIARYKALDEAIKNPEFVDLVKEKQQELLGGLVKYGVPIAVSFAIALTPELLLPLIFEGGVDFGAALASAALGASIDIGTNAALDKAEIENPLIRILAGLLAGASAAGVVGGAKSILGKNAFNKSFVVQDDVYDELVDISDTAFIKRLSENIEESPAEPVDLLSKILLARNYQYRGGALSRLGKHQEAIEDYSKAIELFPEEASFYLDRAFDYEELGENGKALADYGKAAEIYKKAGFEEYHSDALRRIDTLKDKQSKTQLAKRLEEKNKQRAKLREKQRINPSQAVIDETFGMTGSELYVKSTALGSEGIHWRIIQDGEKQIHDTPALMLENVGEGVIGDIPDGIRPSLMVYRSSKENKLLLDIAGIDGNPKRSASMGRKVKDRITVAVDDNPENEQTIRMMAYSFMQDILGKDTAFSQMLQKAVSFHGKQEFRVNLDTLKQFIKELKSQNPKDFTKSEGEIGDTGAIESLEEIAEILKNPFPRKWQGDAGTKENGILLFVGDKYGKKSAEDADAWINAVNPVESAKVAANIPKEMTNAFNKANEYLSGIGMSHADIPIKTSEETKAYLGEFRKKYNYTENELLRDPLFTLSRITKEKGFDALPKKVSEKEMDDLISQGHSENFRGIGEERSGNQRAKEFLKGEFFIGKGIHGHGTYSTIVNQKKEIIPHILPPSLQKKSLRELSFDAVKAYAKDKDDSILRYTISKDAKVTTSEYLLQLLSKSFGEDIPKEFNDIGAFAAYLGYDGYLVKRGVGEWTDYFVLLNRGAAIIQETLYKGV